MDWTSPNYLYKNTGAGFEEDTDSNFIGYEFSSSAFGDYDNDGDLDILISGMKNSERFARLYRNTDGIFSEDINLDIAKVSNGSLTFGDYDNDGDLDILVTGSTYSGSIAKIFENTGGIFSEDTGVNLTGVTSSSSAFGDYDNDGDLDILITGGTTKIYQNTSGSFTEYTGVTLTDVQEGTSTFADYDNDGDLDILITGNTGSDKIAKVYQNTGGNFNEVSSIHLTGVRNSSSAFGDYDNDGDLDLIISGESDSGKIINVYRNNINIANTAPAEPENLSANITGENVIFSGSAASDPETITPSGLSYNLQIGTSPGSCDVLVPMALPLSNGYRQIVDRGVIQQLTATVHIDTAGTYYWRVQAIDNGFTGSSFSDEYSFTINDVAPVPGNNGLITPSSYLIHTSEITLSWELASDTVSLTNSLEYRVYSSTTSYEDSIYAWEHLSTALSGWISNTNTFLISNSNESHYFVVIVRDTTGNKAMYQPLKMGTFSHMTDIELTGVSYGSSAFGDYDNDGDLDILITGFSDNGKIAKVYRNTASSFTEDTAIELTGVSYSSSIFADYDNDNDLDLFITGSASSGKIAKVYENTGGSFTENTAVNLTAVSSGAMAFGDYDNDGDLDLLMTGNTGSEKIARVYNNTGGSFTEDTAIAITGVSESSSTFGDYDNDGDLDILITGYDGSERFAIIYQNTGGSFSEATDINLTGVDYGKASFGDYDNDGDLDILISGYDGINRIAKVYQNTGGSFSLEAGINLVGTNSGSSFFFDYDNDGDLDILINGKTGNFTGDQISIIYRNTGGNFIEDTSIDLPDTQQNPAAFGDYDNDGDLDILLTGDSNSGRIARIYRNNYNNSNALPAAPTALTAVVTGQTVLLSWSAASDAETISAAGLNYNLRIGSSSGGNDILSPMALPLSSGYRLIPERGMFQNLTATVKLPAGTYYWSVQSIDTAFAGSEFATETTFIVEPTPPSISSISSQSTIIDYPISIAFQLTDVDGGNIGISASSSDLSLVSIENISFTGANMISDGLNYTIQSISDIPESITMIIDLSSSMAGSSVITITFDDCGTLVQTAFDFSVLSPFTEDESIDLSGASRISNFFDYDNDGDLDIFTSGYTDGSRIARVFQNTGGNFSEDTNINITGTSDNSFAFGDYDNDGDLDILITGYSDSGNIAKLYQNTGGVFSENTNIDLTGVRYGSSEFFDYDNDGDLDILITGDASLRYIAKVYQNTGGSFIKAKGINFTGVYRSSSSFGDFDNDGDLDILIIGNSVNGKIAKVYPNIADNFSEDTGIHLTGIYKGSSDFGDVDNDGDLDILITGESESDKIAKVYQNTGGNFNEYMLRLTLFEPIIPTLFELFFL